MSYVYITEDNAKIQKKGGRYLVGRNLEVIMSIPEETLEGLVLIGNIQVSADAITSFIRSGIPVTWLSHRGRYFGRLTSIEHVDVFKQQRQMQIIDSEFALAMARKIVDAKINNQVVLLRRYNRTVKSEEVAKRIVNIENIRKKISLAPNRAAVMGFEGIAARWYFNALGKLVPDEFAFAERSRRPPLDPFNSMLSFAYTLLMYEIFACVENQGLSPYFGFLHTLKNNHPSLVSDLMEEWRAVIVDSMVMAIIKHHEILPEHFIIKEDHSGVYLTREGRTIFIKAYEKKLRALNKYLDGHEKSYRDSLNFQAHAYSQALMSGDCRMYSPIMLR